MMSLLPSIADKNQSSTFETATAKGPVKKAGVLATFKAVAWSFLGIRKGSGHESDMANLNPVYVILAGLVSCAVFVFILIAVVAWVLA